MSKNKNSKTWQSMIGTKIGNWEILERDYNPTSKQHSVFFKCKCNLCGETYSVSRDSLISGSSYSCRSCYLKLQKAEQSRNYPIGSRFGYLTTLDFPHYKKPGDTHKYITCRCNCGNVIEVRLDHLKGRNKDGCQSQTVSCGCKKISLGEEKIKNILDLANIKYQRQYIIENFNKYAPFDFAIFNEDGSLKKLIEYDGQQHFYPIEYFGGEEKFKQQQITDSAKDTYCKKNGIMLQRIPYLAYSDINLEMLLS